MRRPPYSGRVVNLKESADAALQDTPTIEKVVVVKRGGGLDAPCKMKDGRDLWYHELVAAESGQCEPEAMDAEDMLYILDTSGTTG